jgi:hypothetical protein
VFRYATQITIHGSLPDFNPPVNGYKFLTQNKNGSIGVRFAGIDAAKKRTIYKAGRLSKLSASLTSQGLILSRTFHARDNHEQARADSVAFAQVLASEYAALVYGEIYGTVLPWGSGYAVSLFVGAVPEENVATICERLCGISNEADMDKEEERRATAWRAERAELIANCKKENAVLT